MIFLDKQNLSKSSLGNSFLKYQNESFNFNKERYWNTKPNKRIKFTDKRKVQGNTEECKKKITWCVNQQITTLLIWNVTSK